MDNSSWPEMSRERFVVIMNESARYLLALGASFFLNDYCKFIEKTNNASKDQDLAEIFGRGYFRRSRLLLRFLPAVVRGSIRSVAASVYKILTRNIHSIPPLITSLIVVFITSDAWKILGNGFTLRLIILWVIFMATSLFFLTQRDYWKDLKRSGDDAADLKKIVKGHPAIDDFIKAGGEPAIAEPDCRSARIYVHVNYWLLSLLALLGVAFTVAFILLVIGAILINAKETANIAGSSFVYIPLPGGGAVTRQLVSLSLVLGSFAAFFLVAGQRPRDRQKFMTVVLRPIRLALLTYSVYQYAQNRASELTQNRVMTKDRT